MKRIVLSEPGKFSVTDAPVPDIKGDEDVLIRVSAVGICGSDMHYFRTGRIGDQIISYPFTPGHECAGVVEKAGAGVQRVQPGDRIAIDPAISCGTCDQCREGREHTCRNLVFMGNPAEKEGGLQEYIVMPERCCFKLPENVSVRDGIIVEPLTIALHAVGFDRDPGNIAILGFGPIGISISQVLRFQYPGARICVTDKIDDRLERAGKLGAEWTGNPVRQDVVEAMIRLYPLGFDTVYECCGQQEAIDQAVKLLKPGGQLIIVGIPEADDLVFDAHLIRRKEITIQNVRRQNGRFEQALELLQARRLDPDDLITHTYKPDQIQQAFDLVAGYRDGVIKAVIDFD